tara:strand:+ start:3063 stop:3470 length:408 start_codon:yes stop_codon:yes gene_type:complete
MNTEYINFRHGKLFFNSNEKILKTMLSNSSEDIWICVLGKEDININTNSSKMFIEKSNIKYINQALRFNYDCIIINNIKINNDSDINNIRMIVECGLSVILLNCEVDNKLLKEILEENSIVDLSSFVLKDKLEEF